jgi:hypothetical protein
MKRRIAWLVAVAVGIVLPRAPAAQSPAVGSLVGTWVGVQTWAIDNPGPGAREEQEVTLTIDEVNGTVIGTLTPFFGGSEGASFTGVQAAGDELRAHGRLGKPRTDEPAAPSGNMPRNWKDGVQIEFGFQPDRNSLRGTADVTLNGVKWIRYKYDLSRKRSRY